MDMMLFVYCYTSLATASFYDFFARYNTC